MSQTNWQVWQNRDVARRFTEKRRGGLLGAEAQIDTMLRLIRPVHARAGGGQLTVLDMGCGDGILLQSVMQAFPVERGVGLDGSPAMLEKAEIRFEGLGLFTNLVDLVEADFNSPDWVDKLPIRAYDSIVSGFAIHHCDDERKRALYAEVFELLRAGGVFVNVEHVASLTPLGEELFESAYAEHLARFRRQQGDEVADQEVLHEIQTRPDKAANRLAPVESQLQWLRELGFVDTDCYWKQFELAVLAGYKT